MDVEEPSETDSIKASSEGSGKFGRQLRDQFLLDPDCTYLNHGSYGALARPVAEAANALRLQAERQPSRFMMDELPDLIRDSADVLAKYLGARGRDIVFVDNATTAVNAVLRSLAFLPGDEVVTTSFCYNAVRKTLEFVTERANARLVTADMPFPLISPADTVEAIASAMTRRTRLLVVDHVTSETGLVLPINDIVRLARSRNIPVLVDGAHAPGMVPLDIPALGASFYTGNCHKWLCAPKGAALLWVRRDRRDAIRPLVVSHGANNPRTDRSRFQLEFDWCGTFDPTPWLCVGRAIEVMAEAFGGWDAIRTDNRALALAGRDMLVDALGIASPAPDSMIGSIATIPLPPTDEPSTGNPYLPHPLQQRLRSRHGIEVPVMTWPEWPNRVLRISAQRYNRLEDYERLVGALRVEGVAMP